jgi:hypothetical protein
MNDLRSSIQSENQLLSSLQQNSRSSSSFKTNSSSKSNMSFFSNWTWKTWTLIIVILAILGFNIFIYLAKGTQFTANIVATVTKWFAGLFGPTVKQTVNVSAVGAKATIDTVAQATNDTIDSIPGTMASTSQGSSPMNNNINMNLEQDNLNNALNDANKTTVVEADDSYSSIQRSKSSNKSGWCFIGEDKGARSCMAVGPNDACMSGDIFPTMEVCVNPNLRA